MKEQVVKSVIEILSTENESYEFYNIVLRDLKTRYDYYDFNKFLHNNKLSGDAYIFLRYNEIPFDPVSYYFPFISEPELLVRAYLSKQSFYSDISRENDGVVPARGLKYVVIAFKFMGYKTVVIEATDIDVMSTNLNLPSLISNSPRYISDEDVWEISAQLVLQRVFNPFSFVEAEHIICDYYSAGTKSYAKYVEDIRKAYKDVFQPYRVKYNLETEEYIVE